MLMAASCCLAAPAHAAVMVSNLSNSLDAYEFVNYTTSSGAGQTLANDFTTGSSVMSLDSIRVNFAGGFDASGIGFKAALYSDQGPTPPSGGPASLLVDLTGPDPHAGGTYAYTPVSPFQLAANTRYWAVFSALSVAPDKQFPITVTADTSQTGAAGWSIGNVWAALQTTNGVPNTGTWNYPATGGVLTFEVDASAAPEPSKAMFLVAGVSAMILRRRRMRQ